MECQVGTSSGDIGCMLGAVIIWHAEVECVPYAADDAFVVLTVHQRVADEVPVVG